MVLYILTFTFYRNILDMTTIRLEKVVLLVILTAYAVHV
jgi:hypothetical protein